MSTATAPTRSELAAVGIDVQKLPPVELIDCEPIKAAVVAYNTARQNRRDARNSVDALDPTALIPGAAGTAAKRKAETADARAYADAMNAGKKDPGPVNVDRYERDLSEAKRKLDGAKLIEQDRLSDLQKAVTEHGGAWREQVEERSLAAYNQYEMLLNELEGVVAEMNSQEAIEQFLNGRMYKPGRRYGARVILHDVAGVEESRDVAEIIAILRTLQDEPIPGTSKRRSSAAAFQAMGRGLRGH